MKKIYLIFAFLFVSVTIINAQILFHEDMETVDSISSSGTLGFNQTIALAYQSTYSVLGTYGTHDSSYLITSSFNTMGITSVFLQFDHIAKLDFFDGGDIEYSSDSITWVKLVHNTNCTYMGPSPGYLQSPFGFSEPSYPDWQPGLNFPPDNTWWRHEVFDISTLASNHLHNYIRFKAVDKNNNGMNGKYGWLIDNILISTVINVGLNEVTSAQKDVSIFPQPASGNVTINFVKPLVGIQHLNLFDVNGRRIGFENLQNIKPGTWKETIDVSNLNNGIYLLRSDDGSICSRIIVLN